MLDDLKDWIRFNKTKIGLVMGGMLVMGLLISFTECSK